MAGPTRESLIHFGKSTFIIVYILFILLAGFVNLFRWPYAKFTYPWTAWDMFAYSSNYHVELAVTGMRPDGSVIKIDTGRVFPMPVVFVERRRVINSFLFSLSENKRRQAAQKLCLYILEKYNKQIPEASLKLKSANIQALYWPLEEGRTSGQEYPIIQCGTY